MTIAIDRALYRAPSLDTPARVVESTPPRLVLPGVGSGDWGLRNERELGFFGEPVDGPAFLAELERSGLRGRGGAGFPAHRKWATVAAAAGPKVVVANGHEGEPASLKDTWLLTRRPHLVLDGLLLAAAVVGADDALVYASHPEAVAAVERAIGEIRSAGWCPRMCACACTSRRTPTLPARNPQSVSPSTVSPPNRRASHHAPTNRA